MLTYWKPCRELFESPSNFGTENSFFGDTKGLSTHFHFAYWGNNILDPGFYKSLDTFTSIACLEVWIGEDTIPLLSQDHPQLRQLILSRPSTASDGDGSGARSAHWIANALCLKNIRSLHLIKPYPEVLKAFSELPSPPPLVEFHVNIPSFQNHGCESLSTSLCIFMDKLGPNLKTFDLRCTLLPQGTAPPPLIRLESLKELRLHALDRSDPGGILPLNVSTPKLERLIDHHHVLSGLYHTGVSTITFLGDWSPEWNPHTYISAPNLKYLYLEDEVKLSMLQQYLQANTTICTSLELIEVYSVSVEKKQKATWMRGTTAIVLVEIPFTEEGSHIFEERTWTCDGSRHACNYQFDTQ
ncbi:hypothetical protein FRB91_000282 [Serendipita sp. 411]|nr:hypothetical protein FRB91_000282 [Serendipita sp. 411]